MTCIAYDGKTLAADRQATQAGYAATVKKIHRAPSGELLAFSGSLDAGMALVDWYCSGGEKPFPDNREGVSDCRAYLLVINCNGEIFRYERDHVPLRFYDAVTAMGSGRDYALAAMYLGYDARKAVEVACALDVECGNGIDTLELLP